MSIIDFFIIRFSNFKENLLNLGKKDKIVTIRRSRTPHSLYNYQSNNTGTHD